MRSARLLRSLRACGCTRSVITWLALAMSPVRSLGIRFPVCRPNAPFVPTLASHQNMAAGMHGRMECDSDKCVQTMSSHGNRVAAVDRAPSLNDAAPRSAHNGAGLKTSARKPSVPIDGLSTRGRTKPLALLRPSQKPTRGRRLGSCFMQAGGTESEVGPILPELPERPPGARYLLSSTPYSDAGKDAGTLVVTLPPGGHYRWSQAAWERAASRLFMNAETSLLSGLACWCFASGHIPREVSLSVEAIFSCYFCCAFAYGLAGAFTTSTLSIGDFQWEYKETIAGIKYRYRHGTTEELDLCLEPDPDEIKCYNMFLIAGPTKIHFNRNSLETKDEIDWVCTSLEEQIAAISRRHKSAAAMAEARSSHERAAAEAEVELAEAEVEAMWEEAGMDEGAWGGKVTAAAEWAAAMAASRRND